MPMSSEELDAVVFTAPVRLLADSRAEFRKAALEALERAVASGAAGFAIDLSDTAEVDASGLGILVLVQKRAKERGMSLKLLRVPAQVRYLLTLTKLDHLFEYGE